MKLTRQFRDKTSEYFSFDITTATSPQTVSNFKVGVGGRMSLSSTHRVDWGDGSDEESVSLIAASHIYTTAGTYTIRIWTREKNYNITSIEFSSSGCDIDILDFSEFKELYKIYLPWSETVNSIVLPTQYDGSDRLELKGFSTNFTIGLSNVLDTTIWGGFTNLFVAGGSTNIRRIKTQSHSTPCSLLWFNNELDAIGPNADDPSDFTWDFSNLQLEDKLHLMGQYSTYPLSIILPASAFGAAGVFYVNLFRTGATTIDVSNIVWTGISNQTLDISNMGNLTSITWATSPLPGTFRAVGGNVNNNLAGIMDISNYELNANSKINFGFAAGVTDIIVKASTLTTLNELKCHHLVPGSLNTINFTDIPNATEINGFNLYIQNNDMTASQVNRILVDLDTNSTGSFTSRTIDISGSNEAPDAISGGIDGLTAKTNLIAKGFSVTTS